ncbi:MAG: hypothetical protein A2064_04140 [Spirochaetes bacterium GWB1_66_5]|nr:MAG: hypothetical protein A2064_04140 [Spirochaetes bacterium GWB1_66_5]
MTEALQRNLAALSGTDPALAAQLERTPASEAVRFLPVGATAVPALLRDGRPRPCHSTVDPVREAARLAALQPAADYTVVLGLGGGFHLAPLLQGPSVSRLLVIERDAGLARAVLERLELWDVLADPRLKLLPGLEPRLVKQAVLDDYLPVLHGGLRTWPLRAAVEQDRQYYRQVTGFVQEAAALAADDYAVQTRLGRRWFVNSIANLEQAWRSTVRLQPIQRAVITGAGPSLEAQAAPLAGLRENTCLIATDASLPALLGLGLTPDLVVSIDCQLYSYHHFLQGLPAGVTLALDLASPPVLGRLAPRARYFAGGHPLSRYVSHWLDLPALDTSGGNVAQAAVSLAVSLGAREIFLAGLDFSYPQGKAYSRGTFLYPIAAAAQSRLAPVESWFQDFLLARGSSQPLDLYRRRLEAYARTVPARLVVLPGAAVELDLPREPVVSEAASRFPISGRPSGSWRAFLEAYAGGLRALPEPSSPASSYYRGLSGESRQLCTTLLPAAAALRESLPAGERAGHQALARVREWALERIRRRLEN